MGNNLIFVVIDYLIYLIKEKIEITNYPGYITLHNDILVKLLLLSDSKEYEKMIPLCNEGRFLIKLINGDHFHIWLFFALEDLIHEKIRNKKRQLIYHKGKFYEVIEKKGDNHN